MGINVRNSRKAIQKLIRTTERIISIQDAQRNLEFTLPIPFKSGISLKSKWEIRNLGKHVPITDNLYLFRIIWNETERCEKLHRQQFISLAA